VYAAGGARHEECLGCLEGHVGLALSHHGRWHLYEAEGLGSGFQGLGFMVYGSRFGVWGLRFWV
jgi:hypothetical protein